MGFCASTAKIDIDAFAYIQVGVDVDENILGFSAKKDLHNGRKGPNEKSLKALFCFCKISCLYDKKLMVLKIDVLSLRLKSMKTFWVSQQRGTCKNRRNWDQMRSS